MIVIFPLSRPSRVILVVLGLECNQVYTVAVYSWSIANNFVIDVYCRCLEILCQIAFSSIANYFRFYRKKQFGIESVGIYSRNL